MTDFVKIVVGCLILMIVMMVIFRGWVSSPDVVHICLGDKCIYCRKSVDLNHVHNGAGYDTNLIHEYMVRNGSYPEITTQGARIIFMCHTLQHYVL